MARMPAGTQAWGLLEQALSALVPVFPGTAAPHYGARMTEAIWFLLIGGLFILMAMSSRIISRLPMTGAMVYLVVGFLIGPTGAGLLTPDLYEHGSVLRLLTEIGLVISLFSVGMHMRVPMRDARWGPPYRLAFPCMLLTVIAMTTLAHYALGLSVGVALVLAAALAPTDPVLASELRPQAAGDDEPLRFALSGEGGANDGSAYPVAVLGIVLCNSADASLEHPWLFAASVLWGVASGIGIGWLMGVGTEALVARLRIRHGTAMGLEGFFALGLMAACYGLTLLVHGYAFLAVFCAGVGLRRKELQETGEETPAKALEEMQHGQREEASQDPELAHAYLAESIMAFSVELERIIELALMLIIGSVVSAYWREALEWRTLVVVLALFLVARPLSAWISLIGSNANGRERLLIGWLGIRGVGSFYYLLYALEQAPGAMLRPIVPLVLAVIVCSVFCHGVSATPLLNRHLRASGRQ
jgi:NhaP-type Na+/H+ or K+/H+ antiporter